MPNSALKVRTRAEVQAEANLLVGAQSRVDAAAAEDQAEQPAGSVGELWLYGVVGGWWRGFDAESVANALRNLDVDTLYVRVHSPGGYAGDGVAIANLLRNHRARVVVVVDGLAASAASVIAIAGAEIVMCPGSQLMLHDASVATYGNAAQLRRDAEWIDKQSENYAGVYAYRAGGTSAAWRQVMTANEGEGTWYTAEEAVAAGLADEVGNRVANGSPPTAPEDELDDDAMWARAAHDLELLDRYVTPAARAAWSGQSPESARTRAPGPHKPPTASAGGSTTPKEGSSPMTLTLSDAGVATLRQKLGVSAEDADEATYLAALDEALDERADTPAEPTLREGQIVVSQAAWEDTQAKAKAGAEAAAKFHKQERARVLDLHQDKFPPHARATWEREYDLDPQATTDYLAKAAVVVPTTESGHAGDGDQTADVREDKAYKNWSE